MTATNLKKNLWGLTFGISLLVISIIIPVVLYFYNSSIVSKNNDLDVSIAELNASIEEQRKDSNVQVYQLISDNGGAIRKMEAYSQITDFLDHIAYIEKRHKLIFDGFNYSSGVLSTKWSVSSSRWTAAYKTVADFIKEYRSDTEALFDLDFVNQITGSSQMSFGIKFNVKPNRPLVGKSLEAKSEVPDQEINSSESTSE